VWPKRHRKYAIFPELSKKEMKHMFIPKSGVVDSYVVEEISSTKQKKITDFISFYTVSCSALKSETYPEYKVPRPRRFG
jgi:hypothetical protein